MSFLLTIVTCKLPTTIEILFTGYGLRGFSSHMAGGQDSNEQSTEVESSATPSYDDSDTNDSSDKDSGVTSGEKKEDTRKGPSSLQQEPTAYELERQQRVKRNADVLPRLGIVCLATEIEVANRKRGESKAVTTEERRSGSSKCVCGP